MWIPRKRKKQEIQNLSKKINKAAHQTKYLSNQVTNLSSVICQNKPDYLGSIGSLISLASVVGLLLGGFMTYFYLDDIGQLSLFADVMSNVSSLMAILVVVTLLWIVFSIGFFVPWGLIFQKDIQKSNIKSIYLQKKWKKIPYIFISLLPSSFCSFAFILSIQLKWDFFQNYRFLLIIFAIFSPCIMLFIQYFLTSFKKEINLSITDGISYLFDIIALNFMANIIPLCIFIFSTAWIAEESLQYHFIYGTLFALCFNLFICCLIASESIQYKHIFLIIPAVMVFLTITAYVTLSSKFSFHILHTIRFIENPTNSSWYLLHDDFPKPTSGQRIHSLNNSDLSKVKAAFRCEETEKNKGSCPKPAQLRNNALYGYMAWNLGQTKIFCPPSADNRKGDDLSNKCLVINGNLLQPLPKDYIGADSTPDKGNWSINMNQKMNVLIREPQPESCTDRCVIQQ